ncbi:MAG TPA: hypothetical protein VGE41_07270 [Verrucomicrobiae bacterium]
MSTNGDALSDLLSTPEPPMLGPQKRPGTKSVTELDKLLSPILEQRKFPEMNQALIRSCIYLWHDHLDESHTISQGIENADGSYLHAIMHRREPDYWNSKYWFRRVGKHPSLKKMGENTAGMLKHDQELAGKLLVGGTWAAMAFVDECERAAKLPVSGARVEILRLIQGYEFTVLLKHFCAA